MKKALHIVLWILALLLLLVAGAAVAIQSPKVQTWLGQKVLKNLQDKTDADISFSNLTVRPFDAILLEDVLLKDRTPAVAGMDTLLQVDKLTAKFSLTGLLSGNPVKVSYLRLHGGQFNLAFEEDPDHPGNSITNLQRIFRMVPDGKDEPSHWGKLLRARSVELTDVRFRMENPVAAEKMAREGRSYGKGVIDWNHLNTRLDTIRVRNLKIADDLVTGAVDQLSLHEFGTGFVIKDASAREVMVGKKNTTIRGMHLNDSLSNLYLNHLILDGPLKDYGEFTQKIRLKADIGDGTLLDIRTITHFAPNLEKYRFRANLEGRAEGPVKDVHIKDLQVKDVDNGVFIRTGGRLTGLPEVESTVMDLQLKDLAFDMKGLSGFVRGWSPETGSFASLSPGQRFRFTGSVKGPFNKMAVKGTVAAKEGTATADVTIRGAIENNAPIIIGGRLETKDLNIGRIAGVEAIGPVSLKSGLEAKFAKGSPEVRIDSLSVSRLSALGYDYSGISAQGTYREDAFDGRITSADPNLNFLFHGVFNLSKNTKNAAYNFFLSLGYADLHALHIDKREQSKISFVTNANFLRTQQRELMGNVGITNITLESNTGRHQVGDIVIRANTGDNLHRIRLDSDALQASFVGDHPIGDFVKDLKSLVLERDLPALSAEKPTPFSGATYDVSLRTAKAQELLNFLAPGLYVENKTEASLKVGKDGLVNAQLQSGRIALNDKYIKDLRLKFDNSGEVLTGEVTGSSLAFAGALLKNNRLRFFADDNRIGLGYNFDNESELDTRAEVFLSSELSRDNDGLSVLARALPSNIYYNGDGWSLSSGDISYKGGDIFVNQLIASHEDERLQIHGGYSPTKSDTLGINLEKFDLALLNTLTGGVPSLEGRATGQAIILSPSSPTPGLLAGIVCDSTRVSGKRMGQVSISSVWDEPNKRFNARLQNQLDGKSTLSADAYFIPSSQKLHADLHLDGMELGYAESLMSSLCTEFGGHLSGDITAEGKLKDLHLSSKGLAIKDGRMTLDYTRVPYTINGELGLDDAGLHFTNVNLADGEGGTGRLRGDIALNNFRNMQLDLHVFIRQMKALALPAGVNPILYGNVYASGRVDVTGPLNNIYLGVDATTAKTGDLHIPLSSRSSGSSRELLTFTEPQSAQEEDPYEVMMAANKAVSSRAKDLRVFLKVRPTTDTQLYIDVSDDNTLNASGTGTIEMETRMSTGGFSLNGDYNISQGSFHFSVLNLVTRDFTIQDGSTVRFNGDVWNTDLDVKGLYVTKANLSTLVQSEEAAVSRRNVNCGIDISGKLSNPEVKFNIEVPDLSPVAQTQVETALNTEDKIQKQFVYLLLAGSFLPSEESGITTNGSDMLFSNVSSIMSGQLNNIFQKLNIPLDLGLNYQATETGSNLFDVAVSTQLFNNRVIVNGTVGNRQLVGGTTTSEVAGDVDIEIKLNRTGTLRLNIFSHSADQFTYYLDNSQRNGAGITYQREFNTFADFFRDLFQSRSAREERIRANLMRPDRNVTLQIDSLGKSTPIHE